MTEFDNLVLALVTEVHREKVEECLMPNDALFNQMVARIRVSLNQLHKDGLIKVGPTARDKYIRLVEPKTDDAP